ncbi:MAG: transketolase [Deltaproteobacteria bacterium]|nr:transketolase [Deltaproteobacteria bacterium]
MDRSPDEKKLHQLAVNTIRMLAVDAIQKANSGHPGLPMGMADCAFVLWARYLKFSPEDPLWPDRDRFVLSAGHGSMLLYSLLHLAGFDLSMDELKQFRQFGSRTPGHPEYGCTPGVETTTGPLGQGFANGVGMALAAKIMAERFQGSDFNPVTHRVFGIVSDGDLMEGVASEAASLAGHLKLGNLIYIYDHNQITIEGKTGLAFSEDVAMRFKAYGWNTISIDGHNLDEIDRAIEDGISNKEQPSLILAKTHIGYGSPNKQDKASVHGAPLGGEEVIKTKENLGWPLEPGFLVPDEVKDLFRKRNVVLKSEYDNWQTGFAEWKKKHSNLAMEMEQCQNRCLPDDLEKQLIQCLPDKPVATRISGSAVLNRAAELCPFLYGGSADLAPSTKTMITDSTSIGPEHFKGRNLHFGIREHGMGGILNGMTLYGGIVPYGSTFLVFSDYMRPSIRLAALMKIQVIYVFTHDSIFVGEDGPTHQPAEQIAALRSIPGLSVIRPADSLETAMAWAFALRRKDGPTALCLTRQTVQNIERPCDFKAEDIQKGGYLLSIGKGDEPDLVIVASGSEVSVAVDSKKILESKGRHARVISMPSLDVFNDQPEEYRQQLIPENGIPTVVVEAGVSQGWFALTRNPMLMIGIDRFGASAPATDLADHFGFTGEAVADKILAWLEE